MALELVDTPGLSRAHEGNAARLAMIREAGCLVFVVAAFDDTDPMVKRLKAGMSVYVSIDTRHTRSLAGLLGFGSAAAHAEPTTDK